jgi:hypothetical protein
LASYLPVFFLAVGVEEEVGPAFLAGVLTSLDFEAVGGLSDP